MSGVYMNHIRVYIRTIMEIAFKITFGNSIVSA